jgi:hypothetical protein
MCDATQYTAWSLNSTMLFLRVVVFDPFLSGSYPIIEDSTKSCLAINMDDSHIRTTLELDKFNSVAIGCHQRKAQASDERW